MKIKSVIPLDEQSHDATRRQLLEAAGEVFAEVGFRSATVREICQRAGANVAAINYHFGDKETLYVEVLRYAHGKALDKYPLLLGLSEDAPAEKKLHAFVHSLLLRIFEKGPTSWHGRLMSREMMEPTAALDSLIEERIRPMNIVLWKIIAEILGCEPADDLVLRCAFSVVSQCVFYNHCRPAVGKLFPRLLPQDAAGIEELAKHITQFSLAAMKDFRTNEK
jgi:TetR/AcrR family transcriptional regulator, regulator of cefoperazone and chloramphenicol sensitivity